MTVHTIDLGVPTAVDGSLLWGQYNIGFPDFTLAGTDLAERVPAALMAGDVDGWLRFVGARTISPAGFYIRIAATSTETGGPVGEPGGSAGPDLSATLENYPGDAVVLERLNSNTAPAAVEASFALPGPGIRGDSSEPYRYPNEGRNAYNFINTRRSRFFRLKLDDGQLGGAGSAIAAIARLRGAVGTALREIERNMGRAGTLAALARLRGARGVAVPRTAVNANAGPIRGEAGLRLGSRLTRVDGSSVAIQRAGFDGRFALHVPARGTSRAWSYWSGEGTLTVDGVTYEPGVVLDASALVSGAQDTNDVLGVRVAAQGHFLAWIQADPGMRRAEFRLLRETPDGGWVVRKLFRGRLGGVTEDRSAVVIEVQSGLHLTDTQEYVEWSHPAQQVRAPGDRCFEQLPRLNRGLGQNF